MKPDKNTFEFGLCVFCKKHLPLKNKACFECSKKHETEMPEFFKDIFKGF